jgi:hypothetical protein
LKKAAGNAQLFVETRTEERGAWAGGSASFRPMQLWQRVLIPAMLDMAVRVLQLGLVEVAFWLKNNTR